MDMKLKEVEEWLCSVYGSSGAVPEYEQTEASVSLLHQLMTAAARAERDALTLCQDYRTRAMEYRAKGEQLARSLQGIHLSKSNLTPEAQQSLQDFAGAACAVDARTPSVADIMLGYTRLEGEHDKVSQQCSSNQRLRSRLLSSSQQLADKLAHAKSLEQQAAVTSDLECKELETNKKKELFHEKKLAEYRTEICNKEAELQHRGYTERINHSKVVQQWKELQELEKQVSSLQGQLEAYSLPADINAARLAVQQTRETLERLMNNTTTQVAAAV